MITYNIPLCYRRPKYYPHYASRSETIMNSWGLDLLLFPTNLHGPKDVITIEVLLYTDHQYIIILQ